MWVGGFVCGLMDFCVGWWACVCVGGLVYALVGLCIH